MHTHERGHTHVHTTFDSRPNRQQIDSPVFCTFNPEKRKLVVTQSQVQNCLQVEEIRGRGNSR